MSFPFADCRFFNAVFGWPKSLFHFVWRQFQRLQQFGWNTIKFFWYFLNAAVRRAIFKKSAAVKPNPTPVRRHRASISICESDVYKQWLKELHDTSVFEHSTVGSEQNGIPESASIKFNGTATSFDYFNDLPLHARITASPLPVQMETWFIADRLETTSVLDLISEPPFGSSSNSRYKALGVSLLKLCVTNYLFHAYPTANEGILTHLRVRELSNARLKKLCVRRGISNKTIVTQIGSSYIKNGIGDALSLMKRVGLNVLGELSSILSPVDQNVSATVPEDCAKCVLYLYDKLGFSNFERRIGYTFRDKAFLIQALTHRSFYDPNAPGCYERLELLGDAVLDLLLTRYLFEHEVRFVQPVMTDLRSALVNNIFFASLAVRNGFHEFLIHNLPLLRQQIVTFVTLLLNGNDFNNNFFVASNQYAGAVIEAPRVLADIFEVLAGAIYLDSGMDLETVWRVFFYILQPSLDHYCTSMPYKCIQDLFIVRKQLVRLV
uniref:RNase III domain-containing protein n=1 Tax=Panagrellus redivivus TaxID=6233 RepID=A0A7E4VHB7_PANRE